MRRYPEAGGRDENGGVHVACLPRSSGEVRPVALRAAVSAQLGPRYDPTVPGFSQLRPSAVKDVSDHRAALALGLGGGLRAFGPPVALAVHGRGPFAGRARYIAFGAGALELVADKLPSTPSRWSRGGMSARLAFSAAGGHALAGDPGAVIAATAAVGSAFVGSHLRVRVLGRRRQFLAALIEDTISYTLVLVATVPLH
jgi:uncharacterized membrane protein